LYGLDRYSEDLDFSLLQSSKAFSLDAYGQTLRREIASFGFEVSFEVRQKTADSAIESAFLKANTAEQLIVTQATPTALHRHQTLKIKLEIDTDPPPCFYAPPLSPQPLCGRCRNSPGSISRTAATQRHSALSPLTHNADRRTSVLTLHISRR